ncbi:MAG: hypothetical protein ACYC3G_00190 [Minisyncoccota bacterium]
MNTKIKLFLLLTFGLILLFTQNSLAAYVNDAQQSTTINNSDVTNKCGVLGSTGVNWSNYDTNRFCLFDQSNIKPALDGYGTIGFKIESIKVPYSIAQNLWKTIDSTGPVYFGSMGSCQKETNKRCWSPLGPGGDRIFLPASILSSTFTIPQIFDNVKTEIIRSCLPGKITTSSKSRVINLCCHINYYDPPRDTYANINSANYNTWSFAGCDPLSNSVSMRINDDSINETIRLAIGRPLNLSWSLSNPSASCELKGFDANDSSSTESVITRIVPADVKIDVRSGVITPKTGQTTYTNTKMGIYTYTFSCAGTLDGKNFPQSNADKPVIVKKRVLIGPIPDEPKINSFTIKKIDGTEFPKDINGITEINQTDSFNICWNVKTENPIITISSIKDLVQIGSTKIQPTTQNPNILTACIEKKLPLTDSLIGLWNYELKVKNSIWSDKGLGEAIKNITISVVPIKPNIEKFEILDRFNKATTSILINEPITLNWKVSNTQNIKVDGNNYNQSFQAGLNTTIIEGHSNKISADESDLSPEYTYTLTADELFFTNKPATKSIKLQRRQPGAPTISKFEFDRSSVTKKEAGGSGYATLSWATAEAKLILIEGTGVPFTSSAYPSIGSIKISIDDLSVAPNGLDYSIKACPTSNPDNNCSTLKATLKVYSSDIFGANIYADDAVIRTGNSTTLRWDVASNDKIKSYSIISSSGDINLIEVPSTDGLLKPSGERIIAPTSETTYTLNIQSFDTKLMPDFSTSVTVGVTDKNSPTVEFSADKTEINKGEAVVLTWNAQEAQEVSINNNIGIVAKQGSTTVYPEFTTLYVLTAKSSQPGVIPDSEKTLQVKIKSEAFTGLEKPEDFTNPTELQTQYGLLNQAEIDAATKSGILDLKVNGLDGPITIAAPASFTLSWNLDKYCLGTGSWLSVKTKAGTENITLKKNGKYTYNLYCPGTGSDSVEITVTGGQGGLLDQLLGKNGDGTGVGSGQALPVAEIAVSTDKLIFSTDIRVTKGQEIELFVRVDKDVNGDEKISRDQNGEWGSLLSNGGGCLYNTKLTKDLQFDGGVQSPKSPQDCNASLGKFTFNDEPGTYQYGVFKLVQNDGKFSNIAYFTVTVDGPPAINSAPTINFRIDGKEVNEQILGTPANYYLTWDVNNASSCLATGSWNGIKPLKGIQNFLRSSKSEPVYTLTCENDLGITAKTIALKIVESPICTITALPPTLNKQSAFITESELSWKCNYADECKLSPSTDNIKTYGSLRVSPDETTTYTLTCTNSDISKSFEAKVEVIR